MTLALSGSAPSLDMTKARATFVAGTIYLLSLLSMGTVGTIVPLMRQLAEKLDASMGEVGLAIGVYSIPAALLAFFGGSIVDKLGPKRTLLITAACATIAYGLIYQAQSLLVLQMALFMAGVANAGVTTAGTALLMRLLSGPAQVRAMSLMATYGPAGYAFGLLAAAPFAGTEYWPLIMLILVGVAATVTLAAVFIVPSPPARDASVKSTAIKDMISILRDGPLVRISLTYALACGVSYGTSLAAPGYLADVYNVSISSSAAAVAAAKIIAMLMGGIGMGALLNGKRDRFTMLLVVSAFGIVAQLILYHPMSGVIIATSAMIIWLVAFGGISAMSYVLLAKLNKDPGKSGLAAGLISQLSSLACFFAPTIYFSLQFWPEFLAVAIAGLALAILVFPRSARAS